MARTVAAHDGALNEGAKAVAETKSRIDREALLIRDQIEEIKNAWTGESANAFKRLMDAWDLEVKRLSETLIGLEDGLRGTEKDLAHTESENTRSLNALAAILQGGAE